MTLSPLTADQTILKVLVGTECELLVTISNGALFTPKHGVRGRLTDKDAGCAVVYRKHAAA